MQLRQMPPASPEAMVPISKYHNESQRSAHRVELALTIIGLGITLIAIALFLHESFSTGEREVAQGEPWALARLGIFVLVVLLLVYGNVVYQLCRLGYIKRTHQHRARHHGEQVAS